MNGLCLLALLLFQNVEAEPPKLPPELRRIVDLARAAPPEFHANALLHVAEAVWKTDAKQAVDLIEESFEVAGQTQEPVPRVYALDENIPMREALRSIALRIGLDALSLRMVAVQHMASVGQSPLRAGGRRDVSSALASAIQCSRSRVGNEFSSSPFECAALL